MNGFFSTRQRGSGSRCRAVFGLRLVGGSGDTACHPGSTAALGSRDTSHCPSASSIARLWTACRGDRGYARRIRAALTSPRRGTLAPTRSNRRQGRYSKARKIGHPSREVRSHWNQSESHRSAWLSKSRTVPSRAGMPQQLNAAGRQKRARLAPLVTGRQSGHCSCKARHVDGDSRRRCIPYECTPAPDRAVLQQSARMGRLVGPNPDGRGGKPVHLDRRRTVCVRPVAELSSCVVAPAQNGAIASQCAAESVPRRNRDGGGAEPRHGRRGGREDGSRHVVFTKPMPFPQHATVPRP